MRAALVALSLFAFVAHAEDLEEDAKKFLAGRPELQALVGKAADKEGNGVYKLKVDAPVPPTWVVKAGSAWVVVMSVDSSRLQLSSLIPSNVLGNAAVKQIFVVVGAANGTLPGGKSFPAIAFGSGVTLSAQLEVGTDGTLGQLRTAGLLPQTPLGIVGTTGGTLVESLMSASPPQLGAMDYSLKLSVPSMVPAPFTVLTSPRLTLGNATFTFTRTAGSFSLSGEQLDSTLAFTGRTFSLPKTKLTFTSSGNAYDVAVEGTSTGNSWKDAFGLSKVELKSVSVRGTISAAKDAGKTKVKGFSLGLGAKVKIDRADYDGEFTIDVENNALKELTLALNGELDLGFVGPGARDFKFKQFAIAFTPATMTAALAGRMAWRDFEGTGAVVLSGQPLVLVKLQNFDLMKIVQATGPKPQGMPELPPLDLVVAVGKGDSQVPGVVQDLIDSASGIPGSKITLADGVSLLTRIDAQKLGGDGWGMRGPVAMSGSLDAKTGSFRVAAAMSNIPKVEGLPKGFSIEAPEIFLSVSNKSGATVASFGLAVRLLVPIDKQPLAFKGSIAASTAGSFSFAGALETNWVNPVGLEGLTIVAPVVVTIGASVDGSVDMGFQAGMSIAKKKYAPMAICLNLQAAVPAPVPKKVAIRFKGSEFGPQAQLEVMAALVKSIATGPMKAAMSDPKDQAAMAAVGPGIDHITDSVNDLNLPLIAFTDVDVALTTPGVTCDLPAIEGVGVKVSGGARYMTTNLGVVESEVSLARGLKFYTRPNDLQIANVLAVKGAVIDVLVPMPGSPPDPAAAARAAKAKKKLDDRKAELAATKKALAKAKDDDDKADLKEDKEDLEAEIAQLERQAKADTAGHFTIAGRIEVLRYAGAVDINIDRQGAQFAIETEVADLGKLKIRAESEGDDLTRSTDFALGLEVSADPEGQKAFWKKLLAALQANAQTRKAAAAAVSQGSANAEKDAQAAFDRLDDDVGKDYRKAKKAFKRAKKKLRKAERAIDRAKDKCKDDLGPAWKLCDTLDGAKATLKASGKTVDVTRAAVKEIEKGQKYAQLQTAKATLASIKTGNKLAEQGLAGWGAVDRIAKMAAENAELITIDELRLDGSLRSRKGTLSVTASVGDADIDETFDVDLSSNAPLDVMPLAERLADEITKQATTEGSPIWKQLRKGKK